MNLTRIPVRVEFLRGTVTLEWGWFSSVDALLDHGTFCRTFKLDPIRTPPLKWPSTVRGVGSASGMTGSGPRSVDTFIFFEGQTDPIGKATIARPGERFRDVDPMDRREFEVLGDTVR